MYDQTTSRDSPSATSSPASASGRTPCAALGGLTVAQFGLALAPANLSATQAEAMGLLMSGISGRTSSSSSLSVVLQTFLESRLRARTASRGSTLFNLTWKARSTPSGRQICALRASARRTSDSACSLPLNPWPTPQASNGLAGADTTTGERGSGSPGLPSASSLAAWPTPTVTTGQGGSLNHMDGRRSNLIDTVMTAAWPTPNARDFKCGPTETYAERSGTTKGDSLSNLVTAVCSGWRSPNTVDAQLGTRKGEGQVQLCHQAVLASWATPTTNDSLRSPGRDFNTPNLTLNHMAVLAGPARLTAPGQLLTGSSAETASGGQLNPGHSRWLMGLPSVWDDCGVTAMQSLRTSPKSSSRRTSTPKG